MASTPTTTSATDCLIGRSPARTAVSADAAAINTATGGPKTTRPANRGTNAGDMMAGSPDPVSPGLSSAVSMAAAATAASSSVRDVGVQPASCGPRTTQPNIAARATSLG